MTNQIKFLLGTLALSGIFSLGTATPSMAQSAQTATIAQQSPYEKNQSLISQFSQAKSNQDAIDILAKIKNNLQEEIARSKRQILTEKESGNDDGAKKALENTSQLSEIYNQVITASRSADTIDKTALEATFKAYQQLH